MVRDQREKSSCAIGDLAVALLRWLSLWLRIEQPPFVGTRCGTPLIGKSPEHVRKTVAAWEDHEAAYIKWVKAHPRPKREWVERMDRLTKLRER